MTKPVALVRSAVIVNTAAVAPVGAAPPRSTWSTQPASTGAMGTPPMPDRVSARRCGVTGTNPEPPATVAMTSPTGGGVQPAAYAGRDDGADASTAANRMIREPPARVVRERIGPVWHRPAPHVVAHVVAPGRQDALGDAGSAPPAAYAVSMSDSTEIRPDRTTEWAALRAAHLRERDRRPPTSARGVHHVALLSADVERTIRFYQDLCGFPLTELFENRDYAGSTHFFFDIGHGNALAFFDMPGLDLGPYEEVLGGLHHLAISMEHAAWLAAVERLELAGVEILRIDTSAYFRDPDGGRIELIDDPLGEMYGSPVM